MNIYISVDQKLSLKISKNTSNKYFLWHIKSVMCLHIATNAFVLDYVDLKRLKNQSNFCIDIIY